MSSPVLILVAAWMLVIGYGLLFVGYQYFVNGQKVGFGDVFGITALQKQPQGAFPGGGEGGGGSRVLHS